MTDTPKRSIRNRGADHVPHPVYSDFSHLAGDRLPDLGGLTFAIGLREGENARALVEKILPLTKIVPGEIKVRNIRKIVKKEVEEKSCSRPDCLSRRERYSELNSENEQLRNELKTIETRVAASKNKIALTEKSIQMTEDKNENLRGQLEDIQAKIFSLDAEVERTDASNQALRNQLFALQKEIERLKESTTDSNNKLATAKGNMSGPSVQFGNSNRRDPLLSAEVSRLRFNDPDSDEDF